MIYYCCNSFRRLIKMNYVDCDAKGQPVVYLQNVHVKTDLTHDLRNYRYCIRCGIDTNIHPIITSKDVNYCAMLGDGLANRKIILSFGQKEKLKSKDVYNNYQDHYVFNLVSLDELNRIQKGDMSDPIRITLDYCPYCGYGYSINNETQNIAFLFRMNYLV